MKSISLFILLMAVTFASGFASEQPVIVNTGDATIFVLPGTVEYDFIRHFTGETLQNAIEQYNAYLESALQTIRGSELQPTEILASPPLIKSVEEHQVQSRIQVRFSMAVFNTPKTGPQQFAALCDKMNEMAKTLGCTMSMPKFTAGDPETVMGEAVARATENAYPPAEAVAIAVKTNIYAVDKVEVLSIEWEQNPENQTTEVLQIACKATVQVTYALAPQ